MAKKGKKGGFLRGALLGAGAAVAADQLLKKQGSSLGEKLGDVGEKLGLDGAAEKVGDKLSGVGEKIGLGHKDEADKCPHCGAKIGPADRFCAGCGRPVTPQKTAEAAEAATEEAAEKPAKEAAGAAEAKTPTPMEQAAAQAAAQSAPTPMQQAAAAAAAPAAAAAAYAAAPAPERPAPERPAPAPGGKCPECGGELLPGAKFCNECGAPVKPAAAPSATPAPPAPPAAEEPAKPADFVAGPAGVAAAGAAAAASAPEEAKIPGEFDGARVILARQLEGLRGYPPSEEDIEAALERYKQGLSPFTPEEMEAALRRAQSEAEAALEKAKQEGRHVPSEEEMKTIIEKDAAEMNDLLVKAGLKCPECGADLKPESTFCDACGAPVKSGFTAAAEKAEAAAEEAAEEVKEAAEAVEEKVAAGLKCPECGAELKPESRFCDSCGAPVK
ncbi:MAG: zinc-ribbon domain-containing protein [Firmicutes bacterium]|nr:zinc-ribbon domain-containing protein [Bacillota bacterium]